MHNKTEYKVTVRETGILKHKPCFVSGSVLFYTDHRCVKRGFQRDLWINGKHGSVKTTANTSIRTTQKFTAISSQKHLNVCLLSAHITIMQSR